MKITTAFKKKVSHSPADEVVTEKIRWSLKQRLRRQLQQLNLELFDEVDDFLFASSKQAQADAENAYLKAMRELRCKQSLFEESFLNDVLLRLYSNDFAAQSVGEMQSSASLGAAFERVEIDLAFRSMQRKSDKVYGAHFKQIAILNEQLSGSPKNEIVSGVALIHSSLHAFMHSQSCFILPLDIRLILIKLFEQHFLLRMEKLLLDITSILNNARNPDFIEKLYSSSSAFGKAKNKPTASTQLDIKVSRPQNVSDRAPTGVESEVAELVAQLCDSHRMPLFIERMLRTQWRAVMYVVGLNAGCESSEWNEAKYCALMLAAAASEGSNIGQKEKSLIVTQLEQGFNLIRIEHAVQQKFFEELQALFGMDDSAAEGATQIVHRRSSDSAEASISPSGKRVLNQDDLSELANLLGGNEKTRHSQRSERQLNDYFLEVDSLPSNRRARYKSGDRHHDCKIVKANDGAFEILFDDGRRTVKLSRSSLAMSLKQGDLILDRILTGRPPADSSATVIDRQLH